MQQKIHSLLNENRYPLIAGIDTYSSCEMRQFESPLGVDLPGQTICGKIEIDISVARAQEAHAIGQWRNADRASRKKVLLTWANLLEEASTNLALMDCIQTGRSLNNFQQDSIPKAIEALRWFAELADKTEDRSISEGHDPSFLTLIRREPVGVVAAILPWNDPLVVFIWKVAPALVCGNPVIVKTSEYAFHSLVLATRLAHDAGIPPAQLQLVTGDGRTGALLVQHPAVACISFTGSSATGKWIAAEASRHSLKRVSLECGGKSAFLVSNESHSIHEAAACLAKNAFYNQGQICSAPTRAFVHHDVFDQFIERLADEAKRYTPTNPLDKSSLIGHMIHRQSVTRVQQAIADAITRGHKKLDSASIQDPQWSISPTIFLNVPDTDPLSQTELFGPVLIVNTVSNMYEAVIRANASVYGLAASIWSNDLNEALSISAQLEAGIVHVNSFGEDGNQIPFGGTKDSGSGKEKSIDALNSYSHLKSVCIKLRQTLP